MVSPLALLTTFHGRINRAPFWLGLIVVLVISFIGGYLIQPTYFNFETTVRPSLGMLVWEVIWFVPTMALTIKRCNDRNWPFWVPYLFGVMALPMSIAPYFGRLMNPANPTAIELAYWVIIGFVGLFFLIDNGFLRGTRGENQHGPDPLSTA